ncbi:DUF2889 domain-containing protein [Melaminivora alkalimesophila]|uniref:DUF2889 family protein n=1 Tax=Melaminivora alkalimesophila TaxID=1165852 RepID=A0A317RBV6_9BURK|nr:DUF2889 domain-containing protein [Melaminivora alkalimesophila]PWW46439.1 hypothetical protein DFR36_104225 [Melaminivora alkalimesophila]
MPLPPPVPRIARHIRRVHYQGFERDDGLWDIEGELHDSKTTPVPSLTERGAEIAPGAPIHHMWLRVTVDTQLVVRAIASSMDAHPLGGCTEAERGLQAMVGCSMARGWRQAIQERLGGVAGCTHLRELLFNLATAAFQSVQGAFRSPPDVLPRHLDQCTGWALSGEGVREHYPQFYRPAERKPEPCGQEDEQEQPAH